MKGPSDVTNVHTIQDKISVKPATQQSATTTMVIMTMETIANSFDFPINEFNSFAKMIYYGGYDYR